MLSAFLTYGTSSVVHYYTEILRQLSFALFVCFWNGPWAPHNMCLKGIQALPPFTVSVIIIALTHALTLALLLLFFSGHLALRFCAFFFSSFFHFFLCFFFVFLLLLFPLSLMFLPAVSSSCAHLSCCHLYCFFDPRSLLYMFSMILLSHLCVHLSC